MNLKIVIVAAAFALGGCSHQYRTESFEMPVEPLSNKGSGYVMLAEDGVYGTKVYKGSGATLTRETRNAIAAYLSVVEMASEKEDREAAFDKAREADISYVFEPSILHWEDRATEWSGRLDRVTIKIVVWDPVTGEAMSNGVERASSKWGTFGGDHPQDLVPRMVRAFSNRLFGCSRADCDDVEPLSEVQHEQDKDIVR